MSSITRSTTWLGRSAFRVKIEVAIKPGQMQLTLIPCAANSMAAHLVRKITVDLATE